MQNLHPLSDVADVVPDIDVDVQINEIVAATNVRVCADRMVYICMSTDQSSMMIAVIRLRMAGLRMTGGLWMTRVTHGIYSFCSSPASRAKIGGYDLSNYCRF
jgi:hypothetical protein